MYCLIAISACMGVMFPTIYGIALDGLSVDDAKLGSAGLIFAIVGGALMPSLQALVIDGGPVAHGYLTLSLVASLSMSLGAVPGGTAAALNYGLDKVRFLAPVPVGAKVRLHAVLTGFEKKETANT